MPIKTVENRRLYRQIADQLSKLIASGEFVVGQRFPAERELAAQLGVSRPSLREALIALELEGIIEVRVGAGIYVTSSSRQSEITPLREGDGPFELLHARRLIEGEIAASAARDATESALNGIRAALNEMARLEQKRQDCSAADRDFHLQIAGATRNSVLTAVVKNLWDQGRGALWSLTEQHFQTPALRAATVQDHRAIFAALEAHDPGKARQAMHNHLARVDTEFARGWQLLKQPGGEQPTQTARRKKPARRSKVAR
jgi:GntR family transcriptional regulator, uxu operon transcriptional repressor